MTSLPNLSHKPNPTEFPLKPHFFSNQKVKKEIGTIHSPILIPKIDKISFTVDIPKGDQGAILPTLLSFKDEKECTPSNRSVHYEHGFTFPIGASVIHVQFKPYKKDNRFLRIELNPGNLGRQGLETVSEKLFSALFPGGLQTCQVKITRCDFALDADGLYPHQFMVYGVGYARYSQYNGKTGEAETHYVGSQESKSQYVIYDKTSQLKKKGIIIQQTTRFELRYECSSTFDSLYEVSPFKTLKVSLFETPPDLPKKYRIDWLHAKIRISGVAEALRDVTPKSKQIEYRKLLLQRKPDWWNPEHTAFHPALDEIRSSLFQG